MSDLALNGKVCLITGASGGIGRAIARAYAKAGARLVVTARHSADLIETARICREEPGYGGCIYFGLDILAPDTPARLLDFTLETYGRLDVLVNNAGICGPVGNLVDVGASDWWKTFEFNVRATMRLTQTAILAMQTHGFGKIINLAGAGVGSKPPVGFSSYVGSKAALVALTEALSLELAPAIQVNAVSPGFVRSHLTEAMFGAEVAGERDQGPEAAAGLATFLASDASGALTGRLISAQRDPWREWRDDPAALKAVLGLPDAYTLRRETTV